MAEPARTADMHEIESPVAPRRLRTLGKLIPWPMQPETSAIDHARRGSVSAKAEIRTKRFIDHRRVEEERYNAEVTAVDSSLHSVMQALAEAFGNLEEFVALRPEGEPIVMEIRLRA